MNLFNKQLRQGFTLVELLVVIAVLGILATVLLVAVDPLEQFARGRDASRKQVVAQLGHALYAYYTTQATSTGSVFPNIVASGADWIDAMGPSGTGDVKTIPSAVGGGAGCPAFGANDSNWSGWCYRAVPGTNPTSVIVFTPMESKTELTKCTAVTSTNTGPWYVWSSSDGRAGLVCLANLTTYPTVGTQVWNARQ